MIHCGVHLAESDSICDVMNLVFPLTRNKTFFGGAFTSRLFSVQFFEMQDLSILVSQFREWAIS